MQIHICKYIIVTVNFYSRGKFIAQKWCLSSLLILNGYYWWLHLQNWADRIGVAIRIYTEMIYTQDADYFPYYKAVSIQAKWLIDDHTIRKFVYICIVILILRQIEKVPLLLAPFEKRDFVGLDMESRSNRKRCTGRLTKHLGDLSLQAGLIQEALTYYHSAIDILRSIVIREILIKHPRFQLVYLSR